MTTELLMKAFDFTVEDLSYNKMGKLSPGQAARFARKKRTGIIVFVILTLAAGIGAFIISWMQLVSATGMIEKNTSKGVLKSRHFLGRRLRRSIIIISS